MTDAQCGLDGHAALFTDLYELTMLQSYLEQGFQKTAVFELSFRTLPANRRFALAAGLERVLDLLTHFRFSQEDIDYLSSDGRFTTSFLKQLQDVRFTGDVYAIPEGTVVFENEPIIQVIAPLPVAQLVETLLLNQVNFATIAATKAARCVLAAQDRTVIDFGSRRAHGIDAALTVARASYLAGASGTSLVEAGRRYGIPTYGTMAHSYIQAHEDEANAFRQFTQLYPDTTLLVDTYDTLQGVQKVIDLALEQGRSFQVGAIRLDSGNLAELARASRNMLDNSGLHHVMIFASGDLDEFKVATFVAENVPINGFGVGTSMAVSDDAPSLDMVYKLVEYDGTPRTKLSSQKILYPGRKQVYRTIQDGVIQQDVLAAAETRCAGTPLLQHVMQNGQRLASSSTSLQQIREHASRELAQLPPQLKELTSPDQESPVQIDNSLTSKLDRLRAEREQA